MNTPTEDIAMEEFNLNIKHQIGKIKLPLHVAYRFDENIVIIMILLPRGLFK